MLTTHELGALALEAARLHIALCRSPRSPAAARRRYRALESRIDAAGETKAALEALATVLLNETATLAKERAGASRFDRAVGRFTLRLCRQKEISGIVASSYVASVATAVGALIAAGRHSRASLVVRTMEDTLAPRTTGRLRARVRRAAAALQTRILGIRSGAIAASCGVSDLDETWILGA